MCPGCSGRFLLVHDFTQARFASRISADVDPRRSQYCGSHPARQVWLVVTGTQVRTVLSGMSGLIASTWSADEGELVAASLSLTN